ncbi:response regulator [Deinococcus radiodurans R1 = ATCC 13939 = DSM 20539]|jgi:Response regulator containing a CheY-like receiver domain and an HTH DNA-binding domain|uniref:Response regulator n=2 Tax=Deinococcus radiodurans TaxID=1299 RepID=Q9RZ14_DEIRA|nr:response regulator [Deinococcus radiodurans R1 = ATCC 13939 = DSM 20539]QEM72949.1 response regulator [Deinococcus radiodurans]ANC72995.1 response regulator [Deinococcus radiodurans R1 = ATCC 13939 = DSM 20539]UDL01912.1 response regulator [Deinococcus radiodurans R1 = ATCC 13939 = DSM 20539]UID71726.1 response regulator [Deinococcus radiodurans R1 = ATCC 13939 = DSM 20539]
MMPQSLSILLVDDNPADLMLAREVFESHEDWVNVASCSSGNEAISHLKDPNYALPDVVITDLNMPSMTGLDVIRAIKSDPELRHIPVVVLSTSDAPDQIEQAYNLHATSYMVKATGFSEFVDQIEAFLNFWRCSKLARRERQSLDTATL